MNKLVTVENLKTFKNNLGIEATYKINSDEALQIMIEQSQSDYSGEKNDYSYTVITKSEEGFDGKNGTIYASNLGNITIVGEHGAKIRNINIVGETDYSTELKIINVEGIDSTIEYATKVDECYYHTKNEIRCFSTAKKAMIYKNGTLINTYTDSGDIKGSLVDKDGLLFIWCSDGYVRVMDNSQTVIATTITAAINIGLHPDNKEFFAVASGPKYLIYYFDKATKSFKEVDTNISFSMNKDFFIHGKYIYSTTSGEGYVSYNDFCFINDNFEVVPLSADVGGGTDTAIIYNNGYLFVAYNKKINYIYNDVVKTYNIVDNSFSISSVEVSKDTLFLKDSNSNKIKEATIVNGIMEVVDYNYNKKVKKIINKKEIVGEDNIYTDGIFSIKVDNSVFLDKLDSVFDKKVGYTSIFNSGAYCDKYYPGINLIKEDFFILDAFNSGVYKHKKNTNGYSVFGSLGTNDVILNENNCDDNMIKNSMCVTNTTAKMINCYSGVNKCFGESVGTTVEGGKNFNINYNEYKYE